MASCRRRAVLPGGRPGRYAPAPPARQTFVPAAKTEFTERTIHNLGAVTLHEWRWLPEEEKERLRGLRRRYEAIWRDTLAGLLAERAVASDPMLSMG